MVEGLTEVGVVKFEFRGQEEIKEVHIFRVTKFSGELVETDEMKPEWFTENSLPLDQMWPADRFWLPLFLAEKNFTGEVLFDEHKQVLQHNFQEINQEIKPENWELKKFR